MGGRGNEGVKIGNELKPHEGEKASAAPFPEKLRKKFGGLNGEQPHFAPGYRMKKVGRMPEKASFFVGGSPYYPAGLCPEKGGSTHGAGLQGNVERGLGEVTRLKMIAGRGQRKHFGMGRRIAEQFGLVVGFGDNPATSHQNRTHRNLARFGCHPGLSQSHLHVALVFGRKKMHGESQAAGPQAGAKSHAKAKDCRSKK